MFKKKDKEKELDYESLNKILVIGSKLSEIFYIIAISAIILLGTYIVKEWGILHFIKNILIVISPIFIGVIIAWLFDPVVKWLTERKVPRVLACIIVYLMIISILFLLIYLIVPTFINQIKDFINTIPGLLKDMQEWGDKFFTSFSGKTGINVSSIKKEIYGAVEEFGITLTTSLPKNLINVGKSLVHGGVTFVLGLMVGFYMLFDFDKLNDAILNMMPNKWHKNYNELGTRLNQSLRKYFQGLLSVMLLVFFTQSIGLTLAGLKAPLIFALFCALTDIIPYFGPYIGAIPAVIVGFTISPLTGIGCVIAIVVVQLIENNFYQPLIMGHTMKLHPVTIMIGLLVFQHLFGIIGMIVATPVIASCKVIFQFINEKLNLTEKITGRKKLEEAK